MKPRGRSQRESLQQEQNTGLPKSSLPLLRQKPASIVLLHGKRLKRMCRVGWSISNAIDCGYLLSNVRIWRIFDEPLASADVWIRVGSGRVRAALWVLTLEWNLIRH